MICFVNEGSHNVFHILDFNIEILKRNRLKRISPFVLIMQYIQYIGMLVLVASPATLLGALLRGNITG